MALAAKTHSPAFRPFLDTLVRLCYQAGVGVGLIIVLVVLRFLRLVAERVVDQSHEGSGKPCPLTDH